MTASLTTSSAESIQPAPQQPLVVAMKLTKTFRDFWMRPRVRAVDEIDFEIRPGEVFGLLGPNGSGKSTTIKMILGLLKPSSGRVVVYNKRPDQTDVKKHIGYLPEESYLYRFLTARETLDYYGKLFGIPGPQRRRRMDMLLEMVGLEGAQNRPVGEFSKGMQRRIGLAQALINDPQLLILDEPTTGMDPIGTRQIKDLINELARRGKTILLCSHLLSDVEDVCDRVSIMFGGKIRAMGTVDELLTRQDLTTIETEHLDEQTIDAIEQVLSQHGKHIGRVDQPRQRLESLFLQIVERAQQEGAATSGAGAGGGIADFLTSDSRDSSEQVIDQLTAEQDVFPSMHDRNETPEAPQADEQVLGELTNQKPAQDKPTPGREPKAAPPPPADEAVDDSVIDSLLDSDKDR